jgi:hypothetical protein
VLGFVYAISSCPFQFGKKFQLLQVEPEQNHTRGYLPTRFRLAPMVQYQGTNERIYLGLRQVKEPWIIGKNGHALKRTDLISVVDVKLREDGPPDVYILAGPGPTLYVFPLGKILQKTQPTVVVKQAQEFAKNNSYNELEDSLTNKAE